MTISLMGLSWEYERVKKPLDALSKAFEEAYPNVKITWQYQNAEDIRTRPINEVNRFYDLIVCDSAQVPSASQQDILLPISDKENRFVGPALQSFCSKNKCWGVPLEVSSHVSAVTNHPPVEDLDWTGMLDLASELPIGLPLDPVNSFYVLISILACNNTPFTMEDGFPDVDNMLECLDYLSELNYLCHPVSIHWDSENALQALVDGMIHVVPYCFGLADFEKKGVKYGGLPGKASGYADGTSFQTIGLVMTKRCKHPGFAEIFMDYVSSDEAQINVWCPMGGQAASRRAWMANMGKHPLYNQTLFSQDEVMHQPEFYGWLECRNEMGKILHDWLCADNGKFFAIDQQLRQTWERYSNL